MGTTLQSRERNTAGRPPLLCHACGYQAAVEIHCKIICQNCGYTRDCSDP